MSKARMMIIGALLLTCTGVSAQGIDIQKVRNWYFSMNQSEDAPARLYEQLKSPGLDKNPVLVAYRGAARTASAGSAPGPVKKLQYFNQGKDDLEKAVRMKPDDPEIRFLRLATQLKAPAFLGYSGEVDDDRTFILRALADARVNASNKYLYGKICSFLLSEGELTPEETRQVKLQLARINSGSNG